MENEIKKIYVDENPDKITCTACGNLILIGQFAYTHRGDIGCSAQCIVDLTCDNVWDDELGCATEIRKCPVCKED